MRNTKTFEEYLFDTIEDNSRRNIADYRSVKMLKEGSFTVDAEMKRVFGSSNLPAFSEVEKIAEEDQNNVSGALQQNSDDTVNYATNEAQPTEQQDVTQPVAQQGAAQQVQVSPEALPAESNVSPEAQQIAAESAYNEQQAIAAQQQFQQTQQQLAQTQQQMTQIQQDYESQLQQAQALMDSQAQKMQALSQQLMQVQNDKINADQTVLALKEAVQKYRQFISQVASVDPTTQVTAEGIGQSAIAQSISSIGQPQPIVGQAVPPSISADTTPSTDANTTPVDEVPSEVPTDVKNQVEQAQNAQTNAQLQKQQAIQKLKTVQQKIVQNTNSPQVPKLGSILLNVLSRR